MITLASCFAECSIALEVSEGRTSCNHHRRILDLKGFVSKPCPTMEHSRTNARPMDVEDFFRSANERVSRFAQAQVYLYRQDVALHDYFHALDSNMLYGRKDGHMSRPSVNPLAEWSFRVADKARRFIRPPKIKVDVLFCPTLYFGRKTEVRFLIETLLGLCQTGAEILCFLPVYAPFRKELDEKLEAAGYSKQVRFLDPVMPSGTTDSRMRAIAAKLRGRAAYFETVETLEPHGLSPTASALADFEKTAVYIEAWDRLAASIEFEAVVARCHWYELGSSVCRAGLERGKPVITFQQGVVDYSMDVPVLASKFVAFGASSASVLAQLNSRFFDAVGRPESPVEFLPAGCLFDVVTPLPDQFSLRTVLLIDSHLVEGDPFGQRVEVQSLLRLAEQLLRTQPALRRLVIRLHPHWSQHDVEACLELARKYRDVCELSHPVWPLEDDLRRSSVVVGIASGVLSVASASGLPAIFIRNEEGYWIRDLECFSPEQTLLPDAAFRQLERLLTDREAYARARQTAMRNAREYYANGANATLDGAFFTGLLSSERAEKALLDGAR